MTQKFGPYFDHSIELFFSLHNDEPQNQQKAKFTLSVEVRKLKQNEESKMKQMNLCGQFELENEQWKQNFCELLFLNC